MRNIRHKFSVDDVIIVRPGIIDPDFGTDINGWVGTVESIECNNRLAPLYKVRWDKNTLSKAEHLRFACKDMGLDFESMYLLESDIDLYSSGMGLAFLNTCWVNTITPNELISNYISRGWV